MNGVQVFNYGVEGFAGGFQEVRVLERGGEPWFVAKDVAEALGYSWNGTQRIEHVPEEWRGVTSVVTPSGKQDMAVLSEQGLYFFLGRSDKPLALPFQKWIAGEVLPSIRKTGAYIATPKTYIEALEALVASEKEKMLLEAKAETLEIALNESLQFYTVAKFNRERRMGWDMPEAQGIGKRLAAYCRSRSIEIQPCETNDERFGTVNSYPLTAWEDFLENECGAKDAPKPESRLKWGIF